MGADKNPPAGLTTSRRNLARMSALVGVAMVAKAAPAAAGPFHWLAELFGFGGHRRTPQDSHFQMGLGTQQGLAASSPGSRRAPMSVGCCYCPRPVCGLCSRPSHCG